jgi:hypothetical protein
MQLPTRPAAANAFNQSPHTPAAVDDLAIMPLLRRGVKNIIACVATRADPTAMTKQEFATGTCVWLRAANAPAVAWPET